MSCVFKDCKSNARKIRISKELTVLSFHRFPRDEELKKEWLRRVNRPEWVWHKYSQVCSRHFENDAFEPNEIVKWRRLKLNALPTLNLPETDPSENAKMVHKAIKVEHSYSILAEPINNAVTQDLPILPTPVEEASEAESTTDTHVDIKVELPILPTPVEEASDAGSTTDTHVDIKVELELQDDATLEDETSLERINEPKPSTTTSKKKKDSYSRKSIGKTNILTAEQFSCIKQKHGPECPIHEGIISRLQKELDRAKKISQQRLRKINALTKSLSRQKKKTDLLYDKLLKKVNEEEMKAEYLMMF